MNSPKYKLLQEFLLSARKSGDKSLLTIYSTMKGELDNMIKSNPTENVEDMIERYALKSKKNLEEFKPEGYQIELDALQSFLPQPVSEEEINQFIRELKTQSIDQKQWMGKIMSNFKGLDPQVVRGLISKASQ